MKKYKHIITYLGHGTWTDTTGKDWVNGTADEFETDMDENQFLNSRKDIDFMIRYGSMKINSMSIDTKAPQGKLDDQDDIKEKTGNTRETKTKSDEEKQVKKPIIVQK